MNEKIIRLPRLENPDDYVVGDGINRPKRNMICVTCLEANEKDSTAKEEENQFKPVLEPVLKSCRICNPNLSWFTPGIPLPGRRVKGGLPNHTIATPSYRAFKPHIGQQDRATEVIGVAQCGMSFSDSPMQQEQHFEDANERFTSDMVPSTDSNFELQKLSLKPRRKRQNLTGRRKSRKKKKSKK